MPTNISAAAARRIAIAAQGLATARPAGRIDKRHLRKVLDNVGLIQIDSVNVLVRSQELPLFSRLGNHPRSLIAEATANGELFEYWGHEAAHIPTTHHHLFRWRMEQAKRGEMWGSLAELHQKNPAFVADVLRRVKKDGPLVSGDLRTRVGPKGSWWDWDAGKQALEFLFWRGEITARRRDSDFARMYDTTERALPTEVLKQKTPTEDASRKELLLMAAHSMGVATFRDMADYYRQKPKDCLHLLPGLLKSGAIQEVHVEGWKERAFLHCDARVPRSVSARALLSPFDSLVWYRPRVERVFNFRYRIEIYTPAPQRVYGYYVLPFLLGDSLVARVDVKADRHAGKLLVHGAFGEDGIDGLRVAKELFAELTLMAQWLELDAVVIGSRGNLSRQLRQVSRRR